MGIKREVLQIIIGAILFSLALQIGFIKVQGNFLSNVVAAAVIMIVTRIIAVALGGK